MFVNESLQIVFSTFFDSQCQNLQKERPKKRTLDWAAKVQFQPDGVTNSETQNSRFRLLNVTFLENLGIRTIFLRQPEQAGFRGFKLMEINVATAVFQVFCFWEQPKIPCIFVDHSWSYNARNFYSFLWRPKNQKNLMNESGPPNFVIRTSRFSILGKIFG